MKLGAAGDTEVGGLALAELAVGTGAFPLRRHFPLETGHVQQQTAFAGNIGGQIHREAVSVVELEHRFAGKDLVALDKRAMSSSSSFMPCDRVSAKRSSSWRMTRVT